MPLRLGTQVCLASSESPGRRGLNPVRKMLHFQPSDFFLDLIKIHSFPTGQLEIPKREEIIWFLLCEDSTHHHPTDHLLKWFLSQGSAVRVLEGKQCFLNCH